MTDKIILTGVHVACRLGVPAEERAAPQEVSVDLELRLDLTRAGKSDRFADTIDYVEIRDTLEAVAGEREYLLVESLAESMAQSVLARFPAPEVAITIHKPQALRAFRVDDTAIQIVRHK